MATNKNQIYMVVGILLRCLSKVSAAGFDLTCTSNQPLLLPGDGDNRVTGFPDDNAAGSIIDFSRAVDTRNGNGTDLPTDSIEQDIPGVDDAKRLIMPSTGGKERIGVFNCEASKGGTTYKIPTIILHETGDPQPVHKTITANLGDTAILEVTTTTSDAFYWFKDGLDNETYPNKTQVTFDPVDISDAGFYECAIDGERAYGTQAMMRLIVRECAANLWSPPSCDEHCPICYNGGICDDKTGECICGAGFGGTFCETTYGRNRFGQDGTFVCRSSDDDACRVILFCQLDPYGCSCSAGYHGRDCELDCNQGTFGADCKQTCHCQSGDSCDGATGECSSGCESGWRGPNCQEAGIALNWLNVHSQTSESVTVSWDDVIGATAYIIQYQLTNFDQCDSAIGTIEYHSTTMTTSIVITELLPYSTYTIYITPIEATNCEGTQEIINGTTLEIPPQGIPTNVILTHTSTNSLEFSWQEVPCGSRGGDLTYDYELTGDLSRSDYVFGSSATITGLDACSSYQFRVRATNSEGSTSYTANIPAESDDEAPGYVTSFAVYQIPNGLYVTWLSPHPPCADMFKVSTVLFYQDLCNSTRGPKTLFGDTSENYITITGLIPYSSYIVYVQTVNNQTGDGVETSTTGVTESTAPSAPPANIIASIVTNTSLSFDWDRVPCGSRGGPNEFTYQMTNTEGTTIATGDTSDLTVDIDGLIPCSDYRFRVKAFNDAGQGDYSDRYEVETNIGVLGPIQSLTQLGTTSNSVTLSWDAQVESLCSTDNYFIEYALINRDQCEEITIPTWVAHGFESYTSVTITGLEPFSTYWVRVYPVNSFGFGKVSNVITITTTEAAPSGPPTEIKSTPGKDSITFSWKEPDCGKRNGVISYYIYTLKPDDKKVVIGYTTVTIDNLNPCTTYELQIKAVNSAGEGSVGTCEDTTQNDAPLSPTGLSVSGEQNKGEITIVWEEPMPAYCPIIKYTVSLREVYKPYDENFIPPKDSTDYSTTEKQYIFSNLQPSTVHEVYVYAHTESGMGDFSAQSFSTLPAGDGETDGQENTISVTVFITIIVLMVFVIALSVILNLKLWHDKRGQPSEGPSPNLRNQHEFTEDHEMKPYANLAYADDHTPYEIVTINSESVNWTIEWSDLTLSANILGKGSFGEVREGTCKKEGRIVTVAVKSLRSNATATDKIDFKSEYETMKRIGDHKNVVCLVGACEHEGTLYVALEYAICGDLRSYLRTTRRRNQKGTAHQLSPKMLLQFAYDVANGMSHLSSIGIIHRDLAARNILLDGDLVAKVSDFGMSRGEDIYVKTSKTRIPTRWLAIESLCYNTYTTKSDVWSFAVVVWEIATLGATPYSDIASHEIPHYLKDGYRMPQPASLDPAVYNIMMECWNANPEERPSFARIAWTFKDILSVKERAYVDTSVYANVKLPQIEPERDDY